MEKEWFTVAELENETKIPHQTIRRYIKVHGHHLILKKKHKSYFINYKSVQVILKIRSMYSDGKTSEQVDEYLADSGVPMTISIEKDHEQMSISISDTLLELRNDISKLHEKLNEQEKFNQLLIEKMSEQNDQIKYQQNYIDEKITKRDEALMRSLKETLETKKLIASAKQSKKKWWLLWLK
jgi:hypothetical protein